MDFKDQMIEAVERGWATPADSYEFVREAWARKGDEVRKARRMALGAAQTPSVEDDECDCYYCEPLDAA